MMDTLQTINLTKQKPNWFWCPLCQHNRKQSGMMGIWVSPVGNELGYVVCKKCIPKMMEAREEDRPRVAQQIEKNLIRKYPLLLVALPLGYEVGLDERLSQ